MNNRFYRKQILPRLEKNKVVAFVDGSFNKRTREYGSGVVIIYNESEQPVEISKMGNKAEYAASWNIAGELLAAGLAMKWAVDNDYKKISIFYDLQGIEEWATGRWKTKKEITQNYKKYYDSIKNKLEVEFVKVKAHSGNFYNDWADRLAESNL